MHQALPYGKRRKYPHMKPADIAIWERFIEKYPEMYHTVSYDFEIGTGPGFSTVVNPENGGEDLALYQWKMDAVGYKGTRVDLIEVKPRAGLSAIGQAACYELLWKRDIDPEGDDRAVIITDELRPDIKYLCDKLKIDIFVV